MTEQERFEAWFSTHPDFKVLAGMFGNPFSRKADGSYWLSVVRTAFDSWQAAQQKEGYVLVPVESVQEVLSWLDDNSDAFEYAASSHVRDCIKHRDILQQAIEAAQEAE